MKALIPSKRTLLKFVRDAAMAAAAGAVLALAQFVEAIDLAPESYYAMVTPVVAMLLYRVGRAMKGQEPT